MATKKSTKKLDAELNYNDPRYRWYAVITQTGMESNVQKNLLDRIDKLGLQDSFGGIVIPTVTTEKIDENGKRKQMEMKLMPGYVLIQMDFGVPAAIKCVQDTPRVSKFVGSAPNKPPMPMSNEEVYNLMHRTEAKKEEVKEQVQVPFEKGEKVRVKSGHFTDFKGEVEEVNGKSGKVRILVQVFGRATPVDLEISAVERIPEG